MIPYLPKQISYKALLTYAASLIVISLAFFRYSMKIGYIILGFIWVTGFFLLVNSLSKGWLKMTQRRYIQLLFSIAILLRLTWMVASYFYYIRATGIPFEFGTADALGYHEEAKWLAASKWSVAWNYYFGPGSFGISDAGYPLYLTVLYKIFGPNIMIARIFKCLLSAWTCILIYKLSARTFGEEVGRMAGIMAMLMPNLVIYCGYHLKETEMIFLEIAFLERTDHLIRSRRYSLWTLLVPTLLAGSLFFFRTVLGAAAVFAFVTIVLVSSSPSMKRGGKRLAIIFWGVLCIGTIISSTSTLEIESYWEEKDVNATKKRLEQTSRGSLWAQYATSAVMAPMTFVLPFSTMVDVDQQYGQQEKHGGNFIRNFMGIFAILAIYEAVRRKRWRDFALIGSFAIAYLAVVGVSGFSNSERFLLPGLPCLIMMWAYGVSTLRESTYQFVTPWCIIVFLMEVGWAYFKLGSRGLF